MSAAPADDPEAYRPVVLRPEIPADAEILQRYRSDPTYLTIDRIEAQRQDLAEVLPAVGADLREEPTRWVCFPWRRTVVHLLGPRAFHRLRLDRNRNKITTEEQDRLSARTIGIVGLSVGHVIAHTLALEGLCGRLRLADFDILELSNLNRIPATVLDLGANKAVLAARRIAELDPYLPVEVVTSGLTPETMDEFMAGLDIVIEECDSLDIKVMLRESARAAGIPVVMETSDRGLLDVERFDREPDRPVFHGLLGDIGAARLRGLSTHDKVPHVLRILEPQELSARMAASMTEVDRTVTTWPQLAGDVTLGAATVAATVRRMGQGFEVPSGRTRIDLGELVDGLSEPPAPAGNGAGPDSVGTDGAGPDSSGTDSSGTDGVATDGVAVTEPPTEPVQALAHAFSLAPSGGNVQPWRLTTDGTVLNVHLVPERSVAIDVAFRGSLLAIGAGLFNTRVAAAHLGRTALVRTFPDPEDRDRIATITLGPDADPDLGRLYPAMLRRCANRRHGTPDRIDPQIAAMLQEQVVAEGARLRMLTARDDLTAAAEILAESDRMRYLTPRLHAEMMHELRWPGRDSLEQGLDVRTLELDESDLAKLDVARRADVMSQLASWDVGSALGDDTRDRLASTSAVAVVTIPGAQPEDYLRAGAAVERLWILAQDAGLGVQPISPVFLYARTPEELEDLVNPQHRRRLAHLAQTFRSLVDVSEKEELGLVLRLSHAPQPTARSRRLALTAILSDVTGSTGSARGHVAS